MCDLINLVSEALSEANDTKTKNKSDLKLDFEIPTSKGELSRERKSSAVSNTDLPGRKASANRTRNLRINTTNNPEAMRAWAQLASSGLEDEISDEEAARRAGRDLDTEGHLPRTPENLPAVISTAIARTDMNFEPEWHMVKHLPGYMSSAIRAVGRAVFRPITDTPIEEIQVISTLSNSETEVKAMAAWLKRHGVKDDEMAMRFHDLLPGYGADIQVWNAEGYTFCVVRDPMGYYIYGWPGGRGTKVSQKEPPKMIGR